MKVIGIMGSPRKGWNSDLVLDAALEGAANAGAEVEKINLFDLEFSGCISCFGCKLLDGPSFARCAQRDELTDVLNKILDADGLIVSAPIYYSQVPGKVRNFYERLLFPPNLYDGKGSAYPKKIPTLLLYTMNAPDDKFNANVTEHDRGTFEFFVGPATALPVIDTLQFDDYSKYASSGIDGDAKKRRREEIFPQTLDEIREMAAALVQ